MSQDSEPKADVSSAIAGAHAILLEVGMPSPPKVVLEVQNEVKQDDPDITRVTRLVSKDPNMAARLIKTINSPVYGLKGQVKSISHALAMLGLNKFKTLVLAASLKDVLGGGENSKAFESFWNRNIIIARVCEFAATRIRGKITPDTAYMAGLFHDCGVSIMMRRFPDFDSAYDLRTVEAGRKLYSLENQAFKTNHCAVGYLVSQLWRLPQSLSQAILFHHHHSLSEKAARHHDMRKVWLFLRVGQFIGHKLLWEKEQQALRAQEGDAPAEGEAPPEAPVFIFEGRSADEFFDPHFLNELDVSANEMKSLIHDATALSRGWELL